MRAIEQHVQQSEMEVRMELKRRRVRWELYSFDGNKLNIPFVPCGQMRVVGCRCQRAKKWNENGSEGECTHVTHK